MNTATIYELPDATTPDINDTDALNVVALIVNGHRIHTLYVHIPPRAGATIRYNDQLWYISSSSLSRRGTRRVIGRLTYIVR